ncbi:hypothetical protein BB561_000699 [Smittium simulii]|uniref:ABC transporter domain-containing protein n=1 Tax=Smittium simulii TaxID=133385 RepID=A0A2T9YXZ3_9FUNG|nr:hypothetical protein BB561_000699 [Smittium simulii]
MSFSGLSSFVKNLYTSIPVVQTVNYNELNSSKLEENDLLYVEKLTYTLPNGDILFDNLSFSLKKNEILVVRGKSGAGKTTMLRCLSQLIYSKYNSMLLMLNGIIISPVSNGVPLWRSEVLYVHQRPPPFEGTAAEYYQKIKELHFQVNRTHSNPVDIALLWGITAQMWTQKWTLLSGGEQQRISLAIAAACNPSVLLLDEPTSMLDAHSTKLVEDFMVKRGNIVWITHNSAQEARVASKVLTLTGAGQYEISFNSQNSLVVVDNLV